MSQISHHAEPGLLSQDLAHFLLFTRMSKGTVSELKMVSCSLSPLASPTVCIWGHAKPAQIDSKTVTFIILFAMLLSMVYEVLLKIILAENPMCSLVPASETGIVSSYFRGLITDTSKQ